MSTHLLSREKVGYIAQHSTAGTPRVAVIVGATSKWQSDGRNTKMVHGGDVDDNEYPVSIRWGVGGALAQKFAREGYFIVLTTRTASNAAGLEAAVRSMGASCLTVELELSSESSIRDAFARVRREAGEPEVVIYNAGYLEGRDLPPGKELIEHVPTEMYDTAAHIAMRGPFLVAKEVLPAMRIAGRGSFFFSNNPASLRGRKRQTGQSLYYPRVLMRALSQVLTEEYTEHGVHVATVIIDGLIDSPGTHTLPVGNRTLANGLTSDPVLLNPAAIADAFWYLHSQDRSVWTHEIQLTPHASPWGVSI